MKKFLVTGANGMLGQDLCPVLEDEGYEVVETDIYNLDITDKKAVSEILSRENPDVVIHCAAYTDVDGAEDDFKTASKINAEGTKSLAEYCGKNDITLVYISTDYVFDGEKTSPYVSSDEPKPLNNYGLTKWKGEQAVRKYCKKYYIIRTSWLYGNYGKNFVETILSKSDEAEIKVVDDQIGCPTWTADLSDGIVKMLENKPFGIYHICGSGQTSWYGFAKEIFKLSGKDVNLIPCRSEDFSRPAKRPKYSVMDNGGLCRPWQKALKEYIMLRDEGV